MICPCINCPGIDSGKPTKRHIGCQRTCEEHKKWEAYHKEQHDLKYKEDVRRVVANTHNKLAKRRYLARELKDKR